VRILRTPVEHLAASRFLDDDLALTTRTRAGNSHCLLLDVLALRIVRTRNKLAEASKALHQLRPINRTHFVERNRRGSSDARLADLPDVPTFGITSAAEKWTKASTLQLHRLTTQLTNLRLGGCFFARRLWLSRIAVRTGRRLSIPRRFAIETFQVRAEASPLLHHARRVALQTHFFSGHVLFFNVFDVALKLFQVTFKLVVELSQRLGPTDLPFLDLVELFLHARGVALVEEIVEPTVNQQIVDGLAERSR